MFSRSEDETDTKTAGPSLDVSADILLCGECRGNQSCIFCAWHASTTLIVSPSMT